MDEGKTTRTDSPETPLSQKGEQGPFISFIITGFGPFGGVADNPTTTLVQELQHIYPINSSDPLTQQSDELNVLSYQLIDTCISGVKKASSEIESLILESTRRTNHHHHVVILHLGVNAGGDTFQLETTAFNEASFRIPDNEGNQPKKEHIDKDQPFRHRLQTSLPVKRILGLGQWDEYDNNVKLSGDAGRFICNYVYWTTLNGIDKGVYGSREVQDEGSEEVKENEEGKKVQVHGLFVHVPSFEKISEATQVDFVCQLLRAVDYCLTNPKKKKTKKKRRNE